MSPIRYAFAFQLVVLTLTLGTGAGRGDEPKKSSQDLPRLPPPDKPAEKAKEKAPAAPANVTRIPVEFKIAVADLEKQMLRELVQKIDPKAEPKLPLVVKGNERNFAVMAAEEKAPAPKAALEMAREIRANIQEMRATRPRLLPLRAPVPRPAVPRPAVPHPVFDQVLWPILEQVVGIAMGNVDLAYRIELRSFELSVTGNTLTCEVGGGFHCEGKAVQAGPAPPVPPNLRDISIKVTVTKELEWSADGKLELKGGTSQVWIDPEAPLVGFPRLNIERVLKLNGLLSLMNGVLDRELMKRIPTENLPDLATVAPKLKEKLPFLALSEITAYPIRGDEKNVIVALVVGMVPASQKPDEVKITPKPGPAPEPKVRGRIVFDKDGKPEVKLDALP